MSLADMVSKAVFIDTIFLTFMRTGDLTVVVTLVADDGASYVWPASLHGIIG